MQLLSPESADPVIWEDYKCLKHTFLVILLVPMILTMFDFCC